MLVEIIRTFVVFIWNLLKIPLIFVLLVVAVFVLEVIIFRIYYYINGNRPKKPLSYTPVKKRNFILKICFDLPKQISYDVATRDLDQFGYHGIIIYTGRQGYGKTMSLVRDMDIMRREYSKCKVITNLGYTHENNTLKHWKQLTNYNNGKYGVIVAIDETQNWFSSAASKNFPPEMLSVVTQNRKNRRIILGTAQNFYMLAKSIRTQCTEVRECYTLFGCLTIVRRREPVCDNSGEVVKMKERGIYFFVQNKALRQMYDTYKVIENLASGGFVEAGKSKLVVD